MTTRKSIKPRGVLTLVVALLAMLQWSPAWASVARVEFVVGEVVGVDAAGAIRRLVKGSILNAGDTVKTAEGRAQIRFTDGGYTSLQPQTEFRIDDYEYQNKKPEQSRGFFSLLKGGLRTITGAIGRLRKKSYQLRTPVATIGIRGTEYTAVLGNSLTAFVGNGEIEVCSNLSCQDFGPRQTAFVAGPFSTPIPVLHPPSLTPPEEDARYSLNPQYQDEFFAGSDYSVAENRTEDGIQDIFGGGLPDGPLYVMVAVWPFTISFPDNEIFSAGLKDPPEERVDALFDGNATLLQYFAFNFGSTPIKGQIGTATAFDVGASGGVMGWGRWAMGTAEVGIGGGGSTTEAFSGSQSHHYVIGIPPPALPSGTASYSLIGFTTPTLASGAGTGTVNSASLSVNFDIPDAAVDLNMDLTVAGTNYLMSAPGLPLNSSGEYLFSGFGSTTTPAASDCSSSCPTNIEGLFAGDGASHAGVVYDISIPSDSIAGAAAFKKN